MPSFLFRFGGGSLSKLLFFSTCCLLASASFGAVPVPGGIGSNAVSQIQALLAEKRTRTPTQQKIDSQLIYALRQSQKQSLAAGVTSLRLNVEIQADGRCPVDIDGTVTTNLENAIIAEGGKILHSSPRFGQIRAIIPLAAVEALAGRSDVRFVQPAVQRLTRVGAMTTEGDVTHLADLTRTNFNVDGTGVKVGVLSDSIDWLSQSQSTGDLPMDVTVLPGQDGSAAGEGTAMLEIVHDLAPGAQLFFATADTGQAAFADNILGLRAAGCDIILDDVFYFSESPFQDSTIAQAVNAVTADGAWYFSAAGNEGNLTHGEPGMWEGDFVDGGPVEPPVDGKGGRFHSFGGTNFNEVLDRGFATVLFWSDPLGASTNDYDLFVVDSSASFVISASTTTQNGFQNPYEIVSPPFPGSLVVVVKSSGDARFLHLDTIRGQLALGTTGNIKGHAATTNAFAVAAVDANTSFPDPFSGGSTNPVETTSTDGPRRVFFDVNGVAITPGNYSSTGGYVRRKPDIAAADGVQTTVPGFNPFFGTSAAAPHAAAIAALLKSARPNLSTVALRAALTNTALDIEAPGWDRDSGAGIVMALPAMEFALGADLTVGATATPNPVLVGNGLTYTIRLTNAGPIAATGVLLSDTLPPAVSFVSATTSQGVVTNFGNTVTGVIDSLASSNGALVTIRVAALAAGAVTNTVTVSGNQNDPTTTNNMAAVSVTIAVPVVATLTNAGMTNGHVGFTLTGVTNQAYVILTSTNLTTWTPLATNTTALNGIFKFTDTNSLAPSRRFYRAIRVLQ